jgi:hypothetical protein
MTALSTTERGLSLAAGVLSGGLVALALYLLATKLIVPSGWTRRRREARRLARLVRQ